MWHVTDTDNFYQSAFGQHLSGLLSRALELCDKDWMMPSASLIRLVIGYPFCIQGLGSVSATLMPAEMGVLSWPEDDGVRVACIDEGQWPIESEFADRLLICHALEHSGDALAFLTEAHRVLAGNGRVIIIVPNRRGFWARNERSPFGHGTPFSGRQLYRLLERAGFEPVKRRYALFVPPFADVFPHRLQMRIDSLGRILWGVLGGVHMVEAVKVVYAPSIMQVKSLAKPARPFIVARPAGFSSLDDTIDVEQK